MQWYESRTLQASLGVFLVALGSMLQSSQGVTLALLVSAAAAALLRFSKGDIATV